MKRNAVYATTWISLENIILGKISQTQEDKYMILFMSNVWNSQVRRPRKIRGRQGLRGGKRQSYCLLVTEFLFEVMKKFWNQMVVVAQHCELINAT